jgi:protein-S-isoprenylcysteine O-methyltransferase Ste14
MPLQVKNIILGLWLALAAIWLIGAFTTKPSVRRESTRSRLRVTALGALAVVIGFTKYFEFGWLARPFVPATRTVAYAGLALVFAGISFAVWARFYLGGNWSGVVTVKKDHNLVRQGPYAIVRHPIYSGLLLAILGSVVVYRELRGVIAVVLFLVMLRLKSLTEERFMTEKFGLEYRQYQQQVKALIPFIW